MGAKKRKSGYQRRKERPTESRGIISYKYYQRGVERRAPTYGSRASASLARALAALLRARRWAEASSVVPALLRAFGRVHSSVYVLAFEVLRHERATWRQAMLFARRLIRICPAQAAPLQMMLACFLLEIGRLDDAMHAAAQLRALRDAGDLAAPAHALQAAIAFQLARAALVGGARSASASGAAARSDGTRGAMVPGSPSSRRDAPGGARDAARHDPAAHADVLQWDLPTAPSAPAAERALLEAGVCAAAAAKDGARASGLVLCAAQLRARAHGRPEHARQLVREHAHAHPDDLGAWHAYLWLAERGEQVGVGAVAARAGAGAGGAQALAVHRASAAAEDTEVRAHLLDAARGVLRLDAACARAHAALHRAAGLGAAAEGAAVSAARPRDSADQGGTGGAPTSAPPPLPSLSVPTAELLETAAQWVEGHGQSLAAWERLAELLRLQLTRKRAAARAEPSKAGGVGARALVPSPSAPASAAAASPSAADTLRALLPLELSGPAWADRRRWWARTYFRCDRVLALAAQPTPGEAHDLGPTLGVRAFCALCMFGPECQLLQSLLFVRSTAVMACRLEVERLSRELGTNVRALEDRALAARLATSLALRRAEAVGALRELRWRDLVERVRAVHARVAAEMCDPHSVARQQAMSEVLRWRESRAAEPAATA